MLIRVDPQSAVPVFTQIADAVRRDAATGHVRAGDRLPSAREVAAGLGVNLHTVLHAYQQLRDEGLVDMRRGRGAVITESAEPLAALHDDVAALVARARSLDLSAETLVGLVKEAALVKEAPHAP